jgi:NADH-quinone oxidoreductase subunit D
MPRRIPAGEAISRVEAPRGELFYFIRSTGSDKPDRVKVRTPTICNMTSVSKLVIGHQLADAPMILAGIDPCFSCNDRMVQINQKDQSATCWDWDTLRRYGIEYYERH